MLIAILLTANGDSLGAILSLRRMTQNGSAALRGGELVSGRMRMDLPPRNTRDAAVEGGATRRQGWRGCLR
jgi:hypothetical protein